MTPRFGLSAYLRLLCSKPTEQKSIVNQRLKPRDDGYDFHRSFRRHAHSMMCNGVSLDEARSRLGSIANPSERDSAKRGLEELQKWRSRFAAPGVHAALSYSHPTGLFEVQFQPDFSCALDGALAAIHLWNTKTVTLDEQSALAALSHFIPDCALRFPEVRQLAILSLTQKRLFTVLVSNENMFLGKSVERSMGELFYREQSKIDGPARKPDDRSQRDQ